MEGVDFEQFFASKVWQYKGGWLVSGAEALVSFGETSDI